MLALTFIKGPFVEDWFADQVEALKEKVTRQVNTMLMTNNALWTEFMTAFNANTHPTHHPLAPQAGRW
jgi:hypothetical protein